jgi:uncharacterized protein YlxW (UPF0749 family)
VINSTYFIDTVNGVSINNTKIRSPYKLLALGDPETMSTALKIPGGMSETVTTSGGNVIITLLPELVIKSSVPLTTPEFAESVISK